MSNYVKSTGNKASDLEVLPKVNSLLNKLLSNELDTEDESLVQIYNYLMHKSSEAICPISGAYYSSILAYPSKSTWLLHAGANIDPAKAEQLKDPKYRNCAEKQAALSASNTDQLSKEKLKIIFLFRKKTEDKNFAAAKLLPCIDCYKQYISAIQENNGVLVLVIQDNDTNDFFIDKDTKTNEKKLDIDDHKIRFVLISGNDLDSLKLEPSLASRICGN